MRVASIKPWGRTQPECSSNGTVSHFGRISSVRPAISTGFVPGGGVITRNPASGRATPLRLTCTGSPAACSSATTPAYPTAERDSACAPPSCRAGPSAKASTTTKPTKHTTPTTTVAMAMSGENGSGGVSVTRAYP